MGAEPTCRRSVALERNVGNKFLANGVFVAKCAPRPERGSKIDCPEEKQYRGRETRKNKGAKKNEH